MADNRNLYNILNDLWGSNDALAAENARRLSELTRELESSGDLDLSTLEQMNQQMEETLAAVGKPVSASAPVKSEMPAAPSPENKPQEEKEPEKPSFPPFEEFWRLADESVDWTDALSYDQPRDEGIDQELWAFYHERAAKVLAGDLTVYVEVLKKANPLGDIRPYARAFNVHAVDADRLTVSFESLPEYMEGDDNADHRYLSGIALRCARDLMALLPVREVAVTGKVSGEEALTVRFIRSDLLKVRFSFVDPVAFVLASGGKFAGDDETAVEETIVTMEETAEETVEETAEETVEEAVEETVEVAVEEIVEEAAEENVEETVEEAVEETAEETAEETTEEAAEVPAEEAVEPTDEEKAEDQEE